MTAAIRTSRGLYYSNLLNQFYNLNFLSDQDFKDTMLDHNATEKNIFLSDMFVAFIKVFLKPVPAY